MRALIIRLPLSAALWWTILEYRWDAIAFVLVVLGFFYIAKTISRDWVKIKRDETWVDGDTTGYGRTE